MTGDHDPPIKNEEPFDASRQEGTNQHKAASIAAAKSGKSPKYEDWNKADLYQRAKEFGIDRRSRMNKRELIRALRHH